MRIGVLGPLLVVADGREVPVGGLRLRALLTRLALAPGTVLPHGVLAGAIWPDGGPDHPVPALHSLVSRLRRALPVPEALRSEPAGYLLDLPAEAVDAVRFERLARDGRRALRAGHRTTAAELLTRALELWRGEALADAARLPFGAAAATRLEELRLGAVEDRLEAGLAGGEDAAPAMAGLEQLVAAHPLRERLRALHIRALHADGRQAEALAAYADCRRVLAEELGAEPGAELRELHRELLRGEAPRPGTDRGHGNLPAPLTGLVGREKELRLLAGQLRGSRLVTLVGPGGVGKTRLAAVAADGAADRVWLAALAPVSDPADVPHAVAGALGLRLSADVVARLAGRLAAADSTLLVLDGCEHVVDAAARLAGELLGRCPGLRILATGREPLGITGETLCPVPPLEPLPAVRLFTDRARAVRPDFEPTGEVGRICERLDRLPLAIELAAARLRSLTLDAVAERLDDRFRLLTGGSRTAPPRHRTLRDVVAWSWDLLTEDEREAADRAAVFPAAFTAEAAESVGVSGEALHALVDKSLLDAEGGRYRMLDTVRAYGTDRLAGSGRLHAARSAHAAWCLELAERAESALRGAGQLPWLTRIAAERDHLLAALAFARETGDADTAVRLGAALGLFWTLHGDHAESFRRLGAVLRVPGPASGDARLRATAAYLLNAMFAGELAEARTVVGAPPEARGPAAAFVRAMLALAAGDVRAGVAALDAYPEHPDPWTRAMLRLARSFLHGAGGESERGAQDLEAAVAGFREAGERWGLSLSLMSLAYARTTAGRTEEALAALDEAVALAEELGTHDEQLVWLAMARVDAGDGAGARAHLLRLLAASPSPRQAALARISLADLARHDGDTAEARRQLRLAGPGDDPAGQALYAAGAGCLDAATGDQGAAVRRFAEALELAAAMPDLPMAAQVAVGLADLLHRRGEPWAAAELLGAAHALRGGPSPRHPDVARLTRALRGRDAAYDRGRALDPASALARVREVLDGQGPRPPPGPVRPGQPPSAPSR